GSRRHGAYASDDIGGTPCVGRNALGQGATLDDVRFGAVEPANRRFGVGDDGGKRLVELVSDGGGQFPEGRDARRGSKVRLQVLKPLLGTDEIGQDEKDGDGGGEDG